MNRCSLASPVYATDKTPKERLEISVAEVLLEPLGLSNYLGCTLFEFFFDHLQTPNPLIVDCTEFPKE